MAMRALLKAAAVGYMATLASSAALERQSNDILGRTPHMGWSSWVQTTLTWRSAVASS